MTARAGIEPTTLRLKVIDSTKAPSRPTHILRGLQPTTLCSPPSPRSMYLRELFAKFEKTTLCGCLLQSYSIRNHYFLGRHFPARYLKVRCCIDCSLPHKEAMGEFSAPPISLPFELTTRRSLLIKHLHIQCSKGIAKRLIVSRMTAPANISCTMCIL